MLHGATAAHAEMRTDGSDAFGARLVDVQQAAPIRMPSYGIDFDRFTGQGVGDVDRAIGAAGDAVTAMRVSTGSQPTRTRSRSWRRQAPYGIKLMWAKLVDQADKEGWRAARFLAALAEHAMANRARRRIERRLVEARLPVGKTLDSFEFCKPASSKATPPWSPTATLRTTALSISKVRCWTSPRKPAVLMGQAEELRSVAIEELYTEDCAVLLPFGRYVGRAALDQVAGELRASHPSYVYTPHRPPQAVVNQRFLPRRADLGLAALLQVSCNRSLSGSATWTAQRSHPTRLSRSSKHRTTSVRWRPSSAA
jgi:hypothetical protein